MNQWSQKNKNAIAGKIVSQNAMTIWLKRLSNYYNVAVVTIRPAYIIGLSGTVACVCAWTVQSERSLGHVKLHWEGSLMVDCKTLVSPNKMWPIQV